MELLTRQKFTAIAEKKSGIRGVRGLNNESRVFSKNTATTSVFLSHSHHDKEVIKEAKVFFENLGISIYVDWADETMPERTNGRTAQKIKDQIINHNDKFILLATNNAVDSKWCNWEVGIADTSKLLRKKMVILPLANNSGSWNGSEYLQIYPRIEMEPFSNGDERYFVCFPDGSKESVETWLNRR